MSPSLRRATALLIAAALIMPSAMTVSYNTCAAAENSGGLISRRTFATKNISKADKTSAEATPYNNDASKAPENVKKTLRGRDGNVAGKETPGPAKKETPAEQSWQRYKDLATAEHETQPPEQDGQSAEKPQSEHVKQQSPETGTATDLQAVLERYKQRQGLGGGMKSRSYAKKKSENKTAQPAKDQGAGDNR